MLIDILHNKIIADTVSDRFAESVREGLVPKLADKYGETMSGIVMYEDYISDNFLRDGVWYYPLTVRTASGSHTEWICWDVSDASQFREGIPYAYVGEDLIQFAYAPMVPSDISEVLVGRAIDYAEGGITLKIHTTSPDPTFLSGKYSQTFADEMARQITKEMSRTLGIEGLSGSSIELQLVFAPGTYMEHTSENVTYRRLLLTDKGCQARDFWVKWTRVGGGLSYTVTDTVTPDSIKFELGEDVPQKIREKEYRFLCGSNPDKYQSAMGKKTVTEWRELIKRAIRRGDLVKVISDLESAEHTAPNDDKLTELLNSYGICAAPATEDAKESEDLGDFESVMEMARAALGETSFDDEPVTDEPVIDAFVAEDDSTEEVAVETVEEEPIVEIIEEEPAVETVTAFAADVPNDDVAVDREAEMRLAEEERAKREAEEAVSRMREESIRAEIEARVRLEYEAKARARAEEEAERLRLEQERLRKENERLAELARIAEENRLREENARIAEIERNRRENEKRREEEERLRAQLEAQMRQEARERERLAEAARLAVEEQRRLDAEKLANERERTLRYEAERRMREEAERREEERREEERQREAEAFAPAKDTVRKYMSKKAKILFRRKVDLNVIKRIQQIVEETLVANRKENIHIHIKAYPQDDNTINLDILKIPAEEGDLLVSIIKAIGNGGIGITKIILEDLKPATV